MNVYTSTELASKTKTICKTVKTEGCAFITNNGKIDCMMINLQDFSSINEAVHFYDQLHAARQLNTLWQHTQNSEITTSDIDEEIAQVRAARLQKKSS